MNNSSDTPPLILASSSPRRKYLLKQAGLDFTVIPSNFDENSVSLTTPETYVKVLAEAKATDVSVSYPDSWIIGADTIVVIDGKILGKPDSKDHARTMLKSLSGKTHQVYTGYCICCSGKERSFSNTVKTDVLFKKLSDNEIEWYINTPEPFDKAGAYAIQGLGTFIVRSIKGSYTNVVGLPVCEVIEFLIREGLAGLKV
ncbi:MAG: septum formation inhibitor Maf [Desulfobacterales bacterium]|nr:septum formation inhibitor Maf [Deltaproteobacteria bacterium]NNK85928.1 septum formation inhibitor Maf [Desulfobacterales bacterium]NNL41662.1 septum formation inhibitor Maf [Desulfobacterales bacterium]